jgi:tetratricopeptide (TPR) repeat protein
VKPILIAPLIGIALLFPAAAQDNGTRAQPGAQTIPQTPAETDADQELKEASHSYREGNFTEAQEHSEKALALNPSSRTAALFVARTIHAQYKPGDQSEVNVLKAHEAIGAYNRILTQDPLNDEAYKAIAYLYQALKESDLFSQWVLQRALNMDVAPEKRAEAYIVLASKAWDCSFKITELPTHKIAAVFGDRVIIKYIKPKDPADFEKARQCAANGLEFLETAITLTPNSEGAWSYKTNLLVEMSKLAEMDHDLELKTDYERQMKAAQIRTAEFGADDMNGRPRKP